MLAQMQFPAEMKRITAWFILLMFSTETVTRYAELDASRNLKLNFRGSAVQKGVLIWIPNC